jgi:hypothetical protein
LRTNGETAELSGTNVNLRSAPSTGAPQVGRFADSTDAGELLVLAESKDEAGNLWYRVIGVRHGEGWIFGKFVKILPDDGPVASVCRRVRADYGVTPALAKARFGDPVRVDARKFTIREFNVTVNETRCSWPGHEAVFWTAGSMTERLRLLRVPNRGEDFGGIAVGMTTDELKEILGAPENRNPTCGYTRTAGWIRSPSASRRGASRRWNTPAPSSSEAMTAFSPEPGWTKTTTAGAYQRPLFLRRRADSRRIGSDVDSIMTY